MTLRIDILCVTLSWVLKIPLLLLKMLIWHFILDKKQQILEKVCTMSFKKFQLSGDNCQTKQIFCILKERRYCLFTVSIISLKVHSTDIVAECLMKDRKNIVFYSYIYFNKNKRKIVTEAKHKIRKFKISNEHLNNFLKQADAVKNVLCLFEKYVSPLLFIKKKVLFLIKIILLDTDDFQTRLNW